MFYQIQYKMDSGEWGKWPIRCESKEQAEGFLKQLTVKPETADRYRITIHLDREELADTILAHLKLDAASNRPDRSDYVLKLALNRLSESSLQEILNILERKPA